MDHLFFDTDTSSNPNLSEKKVPNQEVLTCFQTCRSISAFCSVQLCSGINPFNLFYETSTVVCSLFGNTYQLPAWLFSLSKGLKSLELLFPPFWLVSHNAPLKASQVSPPILAIPAIPAIPTRQISRSRHQKTLVPVTTEVQRYRGTENRSTVQ